jgi:hypothetical protein
VVRGDAAPCVGIVSGMAGQPVLDLGSPPLAATIVVADAMFMFVVDGEALTVADDAEPDAVASAEFILAERLRQGAPALSNSPAGPSNSAKESRHTHGVQTTGAHYHAWLYCSTLFVACHTDR